MQLLKHKIINCHEGFLTNAMHHHRDTIKSKLHSMMKKKIRAHDSQIANAKENLKLRYGGSTQNQASGNN